MVVITGDLFDGTATNSGVLNPLSELKAPQGIYFVSGNHDQTLSADMQQDMVQKLTNV